MRTYNLAILARGSAVSLLASGRARLALSNRLLEPLPSTTGAENDHVCDLKCRKRFSEANDQSVLVQSVEGDLSSREGSWDGLRRFGLAPLDTQVAPEEARSVRGWIESVCVEFELQELEGQETEG